MRAKCFIVRENFVQVAVRIGTRKPLGCIHVWRHNLDMNRARQDKMTTAIWQDRLGEYRYHDVGKLWRCRNTCHGSRFPCACLPFPPNHLYPPQLLSTPNMSHQYNGLMTSPISIKPGVQIRSSRAISAKIGHQHMLQKPKVCIYCPIRRCD